eukprot:scaffold14531_cov63-Phaeocystis_antarctica.AAC.1
MARTHVNTVNHSAPARYLPARNVPSFQGWPYWAAVYTAGRLTCGFERRDWRGVGAAGVGRRGVRMPCGRNREGSAAVPNFNPSGSGIDIVDAPLSGAWHVLWGPTGTPWGRAEGCNM